MDSKSDMVVTVLNSGFYPSQSWQNTSSNHLSCQSVVIETSDVISTCSITSYSNVLQIDIAISNENNIGRASQRWRKNPLLGYQHIKKWIYIYLYICIFKYLKCLISINELFNIKLWHNWGFHVKLQNSF